MNETLRKTLTICLWLVIALCLVMDVKALLTDEIISYYPMEGDLTDSTGFFDGENNGGDTIGGKEGNALSFVLGNSDCGDLGGNHSANGNRSVNYWFMDFAGGYILADNQKPALDYARSFYIRETSNALLIKGGYFDGDYDNQWTTGNQPITIWENIPTWQMMTVTYNDTAITVYFNASVFGYYSPANYDEITESTDKGLYIACYHGTGSYSTVKLDELGIWNRSLSPAEVTDLWNGGTGLFYPFSAPVDLNRPNITEINLTSGTPQGGDTTQPYRSNDTTPTFTFNTDVDSNCSIGILDQNFTDMGATRLCTGGQASTSHTCTIISADALNFSTSQQVYLSCININSPLNQTINATEKLDVEIVPVKVINFSYTVKSNIYDNKTFGEGEGFLIRFNFSANGETDNTSDCNISLIDGITEQLDPDVSYTVCTTGCDYTTRNFIVPAQGTDNSADDSIRLGLCHLNLVNRDMVITVTCGANTHVETIDQTAFTTCGAGVTDILFNATICKDESSVTVSLTNTAPFNSRHQVTDLEYDREFSIDTMTAVWNSTLNLYVSPHEHEYYEHGVKTLMANCSNTEDALLHNKTAFITIVNMPPEVFHTIIAVDGINNVFNDFISLNITPQSNVTFFTRFVDDDLANHTHSLYNASNTLVWNETEITSLGVDSNQIPIDRINITGLYNLTSVAVDDGGLSTTIISRINVTVIPNTPPTVTLNLLDQSSFFTNTQFNINYTPSDSTGSIDNCSLYTNITGTTAVFSTDSSITADTINLFNLSVASRGFYTYFINCSDNLGAIGGSTNRSFIINPPLVIPYYNNTIIENSRWFNSEFLDGTTTAGVLMFFFLFIVVVGFVVLAEVTKIPALMLLAGITGVFFGILLYTLISAIIGLMFIILAVFYVLRMIIAFFE